MSTETKDKEWPVQVGAVWKKKDGSGTYVEMTQSVVLKEGVDKIFLNVKDPRERLASKPERLAKLPANLLFELSISPKEMTKLEKPVVDSWKKSSSAPNQAVGWGTPVSGGFASSAMKMPAPDKAMTEEDVPF